MTHNDLAIKFSESPTKISKNPRAARVEIGIPVIIFTAVAAGVLFAGANALWKGILSQWTPGLLFFGAFGTILGGSAIIKSIPKNYRGPLITALTIILIAGILAVLSFLFFSGQLPRISLPHPGWLGYTGLMGVGLVSPNFNTDFQNYANGENSPIAKPRRIHEGQKNFLYPHPQAVLNKKGLLVVVLLVAFALATIPLTGSGPAILLSLGLILFASRQPQVFNSLAPQIKGLVQSTVEPIGGNKFQATYGKFGENFNRLDRVRRRWLKADKKELPHFDGTIRSTKMMKSVMLTLAAMAALDLEFATAVYRALKARDRGSDEDEAKYNEFAQEFNQLKNLLSIPILETEEVTDLKSAFKNEFWKGMNEDQKKLFLAAFLLRIRRAPNFSDLSRTPKPQPDLLNEALDEIGLAVKNKKGEGITVSVRDVLRVSQKPFKKEATETQTHPSQPSQNGFKPHVNGEISYPERGQQNLQALLATLPHIHEGLLKELFRQRGKLQYVIIGGVKFERNKIDATGLERAMEEADYPEKVEAFRKAALVAVAARPETVSIRQDFYEKNNVDLGNLNTAAVFMPDMGYDKMLEAYKEAMKGGRKQTANFLIMRSETEFKGKLQEAANNGNPDALQLQTALDQNKLEIVGLDGKVEFKVNKEREIIITDQLISLLRKAKEHNKDLLIQNLVFYSDQPLAIDEAKMGLARGGFQSLVLSVILCLPIEIMGAEGEIKMEELRALQA
jgi:hypothetical protein